MATAKSTGDNEEIKSAPEPVTPQVDDSTQVPQKVTRGAVRKYYLEAEGGANYEQVAEHFNIRLEDVIASIENGQALNG